MRCLLRCVFIEDQLQLEEEHEPHTDYVPSTYKANGLLPLVCFISLSVLPYIKLH